MKYTNTQAQANHPQDIPLTDPKESLTGDSERFSFFRRGDKSQTPQGTGDIHELYQKLTTSSDWQKKIARLRHLAPDAQGAAKVKLPAFTASIMLRPGAIRNTVKDGDFTHVHLIQADFDDSFDFDALFDRLKADPHVRLVFHSPRAKLKHLFVLSLSTPSKSIDLHFNLLPIIVRVKDTERLTRSRKISRRCASSRMTRKLSSKRLCRCRGNCCVNHYHRNRNSRISLSNIRPR